MEQRRYAARAAELCQVVHKAVADVHSAANAGGGERNAFVHARDGAVVGARQVGGGVCVGLGGCAAHQQAEAGGGRAKGAGNGYEVAGVGGVAHQDGRIGGGGGALQRDSDEERGRLHDVAANDCATEAGGDFHHSLIERFQAVDGQVGAQSQGYDGVGGDAAHSGDVADVGGEALPTETAPIGVVEVEVYAFHHSVGGDDARAGGGVPCGGVVPDGAQDAEAARF